MNNKIINGLREVKLYYYGLAISLGVASAMDIFLFSKEIFGSQLIVWSLILAAIIIGGTIHSFIKGYEKS